MHKSTAMIAKAKENLSELAAKELHTNEASPPPDIDSFDKDTGSYSTNWLSHVVQFSVNDAATIEVHDFPKLFGQNASGFEHYDEIFSNGRFTGYWRTTPANPATPSRITSPSSPSTICLDSLGLSFLIWALTVT